MQHAPHLPIPTARWNGRLLDELRHEAALVVRPAPNLPIMVPEGKPNTRPAIQLAARLLAQDPEQGGKFVRHLYRLFWRDGWDISDAGVLREALAELGLDPQGLIEKEQATARILDGGDEQWRETGQSGVPLLVRSDGAVLVGSAREADLDRILMTQ